MVDDETAVNPPKAALRFFQYIVFSKGYPNQGAQRVKRDQWYGLADSRSFDEGKRIEDSFRCCGFSHSPP